MRGAAESDKEAEAPKFDPRRGRQAIDPASTIAGKMDDATNLSNNENNRSK